MHGIRIPRSRAEIDAPRNGERGALYTGDYCMTWPMMRRQEVQITVHLSRHETEIAAALLINRPRPLSLSDLIEVLWPDPWKRPEPDYAAQNVQGIIRELRRKGVLVRTSQRVGEGYYLPLPNKARRSAERSARSGSSTGRTNR